MSAYISFDSLSDTALAAFKELCEIAANIAEESDATLEVEDEAVIYTDEDGDTNTYTLKGAYRLPDEEDPGTYFYAFLFSAENADRVLVDSPISLISNLQNQ